MAFCWLVDNSPYGDQATLSRIGEGSILGKDSLVGMKIPAGSAPNFRQPSLATIRDGGEQCVSIYWIANFRKLLSTRLGLSPEKTVNHSRTCDNRPRDSASIHIAIRIRQNTENPPEPPTRHFSSIGIARPDATSSCFSASRCKSRQHSSTADNTNAWTSSNIVTGRPDTGADFRQRVISSIFHPHPQGGIIGPVR